jgi:fructose-1-phosphate kinase PfkB-like protein
VARILVAGFNPAWQKIIEFDLLQPGKVNRASSLIHLASGKGLNAARVLRRFQHDVWLIQVLGGSSGQKIAGECEQLGIHNLSLRIGSETRTCSTLIDRTAGTVTELIDPFFIVDGEKVESQIALLLKSIGRTVDAVLYCGTVPGGMSPVVYYEIHQNLKPCFSVLDAVRGVPESLLREVPFVKINRSEFQELQGSIPGLFDHSLSATFLLTDGPHRACLLEKSKNGFAETQFMIPPLSGILNPIGAGDAVTAGFAHWYLAGIPTAEAFRRGLAMGSASCLQLQPGNFLQEDYERILGGIVKVPAGSPTGLCNTE